LIELLVVIAVIALLMAILLPVLARVRRQAKALRCQANLRQWGQILAMYTQENDGYLPYGSTPVAVWLLRGSMPSDENATWPPLWVSRGSVPSDEDGPGLPTGKQPAYTEGIRCCPMAVADPSGAIAGIGLRTFDGSIWRVQIDIGLTTFQTWEAQWPTPAFRASYGFNDWVIDGRFTPAYSDRLPMRCLNVSMLRGRADTPVLLDCTRPSAWPRENDPPPKWEDRQRRNEMAYFCLNRHDGYVNGLFLDWSARKIGLKELWTLKWHRDFNTAGPWTTAGGVQPQDWPEWIRGFKDY
jgi:prepilin-type processing-associated H-X9-DG protein